MKKKLKRTLIVIVVFLVVLLALAALPFCAPLHCSYTVAEAEADSALIGELIDLFADASKTEDGDEDKDFPDVIQVSIPPETVNALLRTAASRISREMKDKGVLCALEWDKDAAAIRAAASCALPLSLSVTVRFSIVSPSIENGELGVSASGLRAGLLPLPASLINKRLSTDRIKDENLKDALGAIHHLSAAPDGSLNVGVYPEKLSNLTRLLAAQRNGK